MGRIARLYRHPVKGVGFERLDAVQLLAGRTLPLDRAWAVAQDGAAVTGDWARCLNFVRGAKGPSLMAVRARVDGDEVVLTHPDRPMIRLNPDVDGEALVNWLKPIYPGNRPAPARVVRATGQGMTDASQPFVSILSMASLADLSARAGHDLEPERFRGNIWLDGFDPWAEWDWIGRGIRVGDAVLMVEERIGRCRATGASPVTGREDTDMLGLLEAHWGHTDFGVFARVVEGGRVAAGDAVRIVGPDR
jgi:uncharacterized protein YcbX